MDSATENPQPSDTSAGAAGESPQLSIVIPVYNEGENIAPTLRQLAATVKMPHEVLVVYDQDTDTTLPVLRSLLPEYPQVQAVKNDVARGPSGALRTGFHRARAGRVLVLMADLCDDFTQIDKLAALVPAQADVACPSRYCPGGEQQLKESFKVWLPRWAGKLMRLLTGIGTVDPTNSFKMYNGAMLRDLNLRSTVSFSVTLEIVAKAHCLGYNVVEIPTVWRDRQHGKTNFKLWRSVTAYFPWLVAASLRGRIIRLPQSWFVRRFSKSQTAAPRRTS